MSGDYILAIDNGTQSVRALVFDLQGNLIHKVRVPIEPYFSKQPGWAEQNPEYFWKSVCEACQKLWTETDVKKDSIAGVTITTQRATVINLDKDGKPLRPAIVWLDQRETTDLKPLGGPWGLAFSIVRASKIIAYLQSQAEANWIHKHQPEIWKKTHKYLLLSGYLSYRLTGRYVDSVACQVGYIPFESRRLDWAPHWSWQWRLLPLTPDMLPELVPPAGRLGVVTQQAAEDTGLPVGLPVIAAAADKACEVIGSGCLEPNIGCLSYGTTATINTTNRRYFEALRLIPPFPAAVPDAFSAEIQVYRGYWMVSWFKREFGHQEQTLAEARGIEPESLFDELVKEVPPGSMGLTLQPYWSPGLRLPGPEAKGAIIGFGDVHTRAHIYRAILEGLAYALREGTEHIVKKSGIPVTELRVSGGGSQSDAAMQLTADIFNLPTGRPHTYETSGLGAAIDASVGLGLHRDFYTAVDAMTRVEQVFEPDARTHEIYDALYHRVYKEMYPRLQKLYEEIRDITGYPRK